MLSFTNRAATSVEPFADQLDRISTVEQLHRIRTVHTADNVERNAELFKEVLRT